MKLTKNVRRAMLASCLTATTLGTTGCSSSKGTFASLNPFNRAASVELTPEGTVTPSAAESIAAASQKTDSSIQQVSNKSEGMFDKTTHALASVFRRQPKESAETQLPASDDPLRLDNKPESVDPDVFVANGQLWESQGNLDKAIESYVKGLEQDPKHASALTSLARLHFRQGNLEQASLFFQRAIAERPRDAGLYNDVGLTLGKLGNQTAAVASLEKALELAPGTSRYANNLASVKFEAGDSEAALAVLMQNNRPAVAHFNMAYLHYKTGQNDQAKLHLGEALKYEPQAQTDASTARAVQRSRDMLAQISGATTGVNPGTIAQKGTTAPSNAASPNPSASVAAGRTVGAPSYTTPSQPYQQPAATVASQPSVPVQAPAFAQNLNATPSSVPQNPASPQGTAYSRSTTPPTNSAISNITPPPAINVPPAAPVTATALPPAKPAWNSWNPNAAVAAKAKQAPIRPASATEPVAEEAAPVEKKPAFNGFSMPENIGPPAKQ